MRELLWMGKRECKLGMDLGNMEMRSYPENNTFTFTFENNSSELVESMSLAGGNHLG